MPNIGGRVTEMNSPQNSSPNKSKNKKKQIEEKEAESQTNPDVSITISAISKLMPQYNLSAI